MFTNDDLQVTEQERNAHKSEYATRIASILPNFPSEVVLSWFNDHPTAITNFFELGFRDFVFERRDLSLNTVGGADALREGARSVAELVADVAVTHRSLGVYMAANGVWPVPPILLDTTNSIIPEAFTQPLRKPFHLLEGYHRFALAMAGPDPVSPDTPLPFWVARIAPS